jgi:hypothetical protein
MTLSLCLHCQRNSGCKSRGLCNACYADRGIRDQYACNRPDLSSAGLGLEDGPRPLPPRTDAVTKEERLAVLEERAAAGQQLWCNEDARRDLS